MRKMVSCVGIRFMKFVKFCDFEVFDRMEAKPQEFLTRIWRSQRERGQKERRRSGSKAENEEVYTV